MPEFFAENQELLLTLAGFLAPAIIEIILGLLPDWMVPYAGRLLPLIKKALAKRGGPTVMLLCCLLIGGCANLPSSKICQTDQPSLICERIPQPEHADLLLQIVNRGAIEQDEYTAEQALQVIDDCLAFLDGVETYADLAHYVTGKTQKASIGSLIVSAYLPAIDAAVPIYAYDRGLLRGHLEKQRAIVQQLLEN